MITASELEQLKEAVKNNTVDQLITKWDAELFARESSKNGNVTFQLKNYHGDKEVTVIGKQMIPNYAFHKDAWGGKNYVLTHIPSSVRVFTGNKQKILPVIKDFAAWEGCKILDEAMTAHGFDALRHVPSDVMQQYRDLYNKRTY